MAFIETTITPEMIEKYDMAQDYLEIANHKRQDFLTYGQEEHFGKKKMGYQRLEYLDTVDSIVIDEQQDCYLRCGNCASIIFGISPHHYLFFYYKGQRIYLVVDFVYGEKDLINKTNTVECKVIQVNSLSTISMDEQFLHLLEQALYIRYDKLHNNHGWKYTVFINFDSIFN